MLFDISTYIGHWPFRKIDCKTIEALAVKLSNNAVERAVVTNLNAVFYRDAMEGNIELLDELSNYRGSVSFEPFAVINPQYIDFEKDTKKAKVLGFSGVEIAPGYHGYTLDCEEVKTLYKLCGNLGLAFKVNAGFEDIRGRNPFDTFYEPSGDEIASLFSTCPNTRSLVTGYYNYYLGENLGRIVRERDNILLDISRLDVFNNATFSDSIVYVGCDRLAFSSMCPFRIIMPEIVKLYSGAVPQDKIENIAYKNAERIFGAKN